MRWRPESHGSCGRTRWRAPDWYVQAISGGMGPLGVVKGFRELRRMGLVSRIPSLALIQADGCAPMVRSFREGLETAVAVETPAYAHRDAGNGRSRPRLHASASARS